MHMQQLTAKIFEYHILYVHLMFTVQLWLALRTSQILGIVITVIWAVVRKVSQKFFQGKLLIVNL